MHHDTYLVRRFKLRPPNIDDKPVVGSSDLLALFAFNIAYDSKVFPLESHRIGLSGCYLFLAYTGARPAEVVDNDAQIKPEEWKNIIRQSIATRGDDEEWEADSTAQDEFSKELERLLDQEPIERGRPKALCYEDVCIALFRDPRTGKDTFSMAIKLIHHKGADRKPRPTIFYFFPAKRLVFCLILVILAHAFRDNAFAAEHLTTLERLFQLKTGPPTFCITFRWKDSVQKLPIFRKCSAAGISNNPIPYHILRDDLEQQTLDAGFEESFGPRSFRRGCANAINGKAPDPVRDQAMRHDPNFTTFYNAYLNQKVQFDVQNVFLDEPPEDALIDLFTHMSITRDYRASRDIVPDEVWASLPPDPDIQKLEEQRAVLKGGTYQIRNNPNKEKIAKLTNEISKRKQKFRKEVMKAYREHYFWNRPTLDIENQLTGRESAEYVASSMELRLPERLELAEILVNQPPNREDRPLKRLRLRALELMVALSQRCETTKDRVMSQIKVVKDRIMSQTEVGRAQLPLDPFPLRKERTQCPRCIGDDRQTYEARTFRYCLPSVLFDHFDREHARDMAPSENITCNHPKCIQEQLQFIHLNHFKNHVERVYGVKLRG